MTHDRLRELLEAAKRGDAKALAWIRQNRSWLDVWMSHELEELDAEVARRKAARCQR